MVSCVYELVHIHWRQSTLVQQILCFYDRTRVFLLICLKYKDAIMLGQAGLYFCMISLSLLMGFQS